jgi:hypothetical protein
MAKNNIKNITFPLYQKDNHLVPIEFQFHKCQLLLIMISSPEKTQRTQEQLNRPQTVKEVLASYNLLRKI